jgi:carboxymethylenebutenolidase
MAIYEGLIGGEVTFTGHNGDKGNAYHARPTAEGKVPGVVVIHHAPGWDEWCAEVSRKFSQHGYAAIAPNLYFAMDWARLTTSRPSASRRRRCRRPGGDARAPWRGSAPSRTLRQGRCHRFRLAPADFLAACLAKERRRGDRLLGGNVVIDDPSVPRRLAGALVEYADKLSCPVRPFGNDDTNQPRACRLAEAILKKLAPTNSIATTAPATPSCHGTGRITASSRRSTLKKVRFHGRHLKAANATATERSNLMHLHRREGEIPAARRRRLYQGRHRQRLFRPPLSRAARPRARHRFR